jgi:quinoprotein glucose dehydrogenase
MIWIDFIMSLLVSRSRRNAGSSAGVAMVGKLDAARIAVAAGGHGSLGTKAGDSIVAYALP